MRLVCTLVLAALLVSTLAFAFDGGREGVPRTAEKPRPVAADEVEFFEKRIRPVLADHCWSCHGDKVLDADLGGEFGRTPTVELPQAGANAGKVNGRDHNHWGFTTLLAGGGVKGGHIHGGTDEFGFAAVEKKSTSTTSTPPSSTCSASTTRNSPTATPAATSGLRMCMVRW